MLQRFWWVSESHWEHTAGQWHHKYGSRLWHIIKLISLLSVWSLTPTNRGFKCQGQSFFPRLMDQIAVTLGCLSACECREMYDLKQVPLSLTAAPEASSIVASKSSGCLPHGQRKPILQSNNGPDVYDKSDAAKQLFPVASISCYCGSSYPLCN